jgi:hypothetical protein
MESLAEIIVYAGAWQGTSNCLSPNQISQVFFLTGDYFFARENYAER